MGKSTKYCEEHCKDDKRFNFNGAQEIDPEEYFDEILFGLRERMADYNGGKVRIKIIIDENADFNFINSWYTTIDGFTNDISQYIREAVHEELLSPMVIPMDGKKPLGGQIKPRDRIEVTFGKIVVLNKTIFKNNKASQRVDVFIPKKYERIPGGING